MGLGVQERSATDDTSTFPSLMLALYQWNERTSITSQCKQPSPVDGVQQQPSQRGLCEDRRLLCVKRCTRSGRVGGSALSASQRSRSSTRPDGRFGWQSGCTSLLRATTRRLNGPWAVALKGVDAPFRDSVFVCFLLVPSDHSIQRTSPSGPLSSASAHLTLLQRGLPFSCLSSLTMSDRRPPSVRQAVSDVTNRPPPHAASAAGHFHTALTSAAHNLKTARG